MGLERLSDSEGELRRMGIDPTVREKGLGSKLVRLVEEHAAEIGLSRVVLTTGSIMAPAITLYERCGWEQCRHGCVIPFAHVLIVRWLACVCLLVSVYVPVCHSRSLRTLHRSAAALASSRQS